MTYETTTNVQNNTRGIYIEHRETKDRLWFDPQGQVFVAEKLTAFGSKHDLKNFNDNAVNVYNFYNLYLQGYSAPNFYLGETASKKKTSKGEQEAAALEAEKAKKETTE